MGCGLHSSTDINYIKELLQMSLMHYNQANLQSIFESTYSFTSRLSVATIVVRFLRDTQLWLYDQVNTVIKILIEIYHSRFFGYSKCSKESRRRDLLESHEVSRRLADQSNVRQSDQIEMLPAK